MEIILSDFWYRTGFLGISGADHGHCSEAATGGVL